MRLILAFLVLATSTSYAAAQQPLAQQPVFNTSQSNVFIQSSNFADSQVPIQQVATTTPKTYKQAYKAAQAGDKPLLILVTADWCPPCQRMKQTTIPQLMQKDAFKNFHYATVDYDAENPLARQLIGNRGIPQIIMFEKQDGQWVRRYLKGIQTTQTVEAFFAQANTLRTANALQETRDTIEK